MEKEKFLKETFGLNEKEPLYNYLLNNIDTFTLANYVDYLGDYYNSLALCHIDKVGTRREFTYKDLSNESNQMANYLKKLGVNKGDTVALVLRNNYEFYIAILALQKLAAIAMPLQYTNKTEQYKSIFDRANPKCIIADDYEIKQAKNKSIFVLEEIEKACKENTIKLCTYKTTNHETANWKKLKEYHTHQTEFNNETVNINNTGYIFATSGTTGEPKLPMHNYGFALAHYNTGKWYGLKKGSKHLTITDSGWAMSSWNMCANLLHQSIIYIEDYDRFNEELILNHIKEESIETLCAPRSMLIRFINYLKKNPQFTMPSLRYISSAGERVDDELRSEVKKYLNIDVKEGYGMTELVLALYQDEQGHLVKNPIYSSVEVEVPENQPTGEIVVKSEYGKLGLTKGYLEKRNQSLVLYRKPPVENGQIVWHTGDAGYKDEENNIHCDGRLGNTVKVNDCLVNKSDVETTIKKLPYVNDCVVESIPDSISGNIIIARIELTEEYAISLKEQDYPKFKNDISLFVKSQMPDYCRPKEIIFGELERTNNGKLKRKDTITPPDKGLVLIRKELKKLEN